MCLHICAQVPHGLVEVRGQRTTLLGSSFSPAALWGIGIELVSSDLIYQVPLPSEPAH